MPGVPYRVVMPAIAGPVHGFPPHSYYCHSVGAEASQGGAEARSRSCSPPGPALSDVPVDELAYPGMLVEVEAIAAIGPRRGNEPR